MTFVPELRRLTTRHKGWFAILTTALELSADPLHIGITFERSSDEAIKNTFATAQVYSRDLRL
tara:strand:- start:56 stop:244 length:189 start_codon:yes stop_codon:yes gene_type:complete